METNQTERSKKKGQLREFFSFGEVGGYFFRRKDPSRPTNVNIRMMHGINKISIIVFLVGVIYLLVKHFLLRS
jgi:hypothetical protein